MEGGERERGKKRGNLALVHTSPKPSHPIYIKKHPKEKDKVSITVSTRLRGIWKKKSKKKGSFLFLSFPMRGFCL